MNNRVCLLPRAHCARGRRRGVDDVIAESEGTLDAEVTAYGGGVIWSQYHLTGDRWYTTSMEHDIHEWLEGVLQTSKHEFLVLESHIPSEMHDAKGEADKWSAKDVFAHLTYWLEVFAFNIEARANSRRLIDTDRYEILNSDAWEARHAFSWDRVRLDLDRAFASVQSQVHQLSAKQLTDATCFSLSGRPLVADCMYELVEHPMHHWMILYRRVGAEHMAYEMLERVEGRVSQRGLMKWSLSARKKILRHRQSLVT